MKNIRIILSLFILVVLAASNVYSQKAPTIKTLKCYGGIKRDQGISLIRTSDGGYAFAGYTGSNDGDVIGKHGVYDAWVVKLNADGVIEWQKCYGGSDDDDAYSLIQTRDGGYIVAGDTYSNDGDVVGNHGGQDAWVIKLDSAGTIEWQSCIGGVGNEMANSVIQNIGGGYTFIGRADTTLRDIPGNYLGDDIWVVELSSSGNVLWQKYYGGSSGDYGYSLLQTIDGGFMLCGITRSQDGEASGNHGGNDVSDMWIAKIGSSGTMEWHKCLGGTGDDGGYSIITSGDGGYVVCGFTGSYDGDVSGNHSPNADAWIVKLNSLGEIKKQNCYGGRLDDVAQSILITSDGSFVFSGRTESNDGDVVGFNGSDDAWIIKVDHSGTLLWQRCIGGSSYEAFPSLIQNLDGTLAALGYTYSFDGDIKDNHGYWDVLLVTLQSESGITEPSPTTNTLALSAYPNPAAKNVTLGFQLASASDVIVSVTDVTGNKVGEYAEAKAAGPCEMTLDLGSYSEGTYYVTVTAGAEKAVTVVQVVR